MIRYEREHIVSNLRDTSRNKNGYPLLDKHAEDVEVYDFDKIKDIFCKYYRNDEKLKSFDAYYFDEYNRVVIEFKKASHLKLLEYWKDIDIKIIDTYLLLKSTFLLNKKNSEVKNKVKVIVVYEDVLDYGNGVKSISNCFNNVQPKKGNIERKSKEVKLFKDEADFEEHVKMLVEKYKDDCFCNIEFMDKLDFQKNYLDNGTLNNLTGWERME